MPLSSHKSGSFVEMGDEIEVEKVTVSCGSVHLSSPRSDSCVGMGDEIEAGKDRKVAGLLQ